MNGNVFSSEGIAPTLTTNKGEGNKIAVLHTHTHNLGWTKPYSERNEKSQTHSPQGRIEESQPITKKERQSE